MKKLLFLAGFLIGSSFSLFSSGSQAVSGRNEVMDDVAAGQLLSIGALDPENYLEDFEIELTNRSDDPLSFRVDLLKNKIWDKGEAISLRISLLINDESRFETVPGNFIIYIQNPELFSDSVFIKYLEEEIPGSSGLEIMFFDPVNEELIQINSISDINSVRDVLTRQRKQYSNNIMLQRLIKVVNGELPNKRSHVLWITDENIIEKNTDASFFNFTLNVLSSGNTTFSYLGYGEVPNWITLNQGLVANKGNSFYAEDTNGICDCITKDIGFFAKPAIEDLEVRIVWSKYISEMKTYYPADLYPVISGYYPMTNNNRPRQFHKIGGMNYSENKRFIHYISIPALLTLQENSEYKLPLENTKLKIGTVYIKYYIPMHEKYYFKQEDMIIEYIKSDYMTGQLNQYVLADTIIQNTPLIIQEVATLVNRNRNYLAAIQLIKAQRLLLDKVYEIRDDEALTQEMELLDHYYEILLNQAKTMNMIE